MTTWPNKLLRALNRFHSTEGCTKLSIQTSRAITVLFDVLSACAGRGYQAVADGLANTTVLLLQDDLGLRQGGCLFSCIQSRSLFERRLSVLIPANGSLEFVLSPDQGSCGLFPQNTPIPGLVS